MATCKRCLAPKLTEQPCRRCGCRDSAVEAQTTAMCVETGCGNEATRCVDLIERDLVKGEIVDVAPAGRKFFCDLHGPSDARPLTQLDKMVEQITPENIHQAVEP